MSSISPSVPCPCGRSGADGRPLAYGRCCGPYVEDFATHAAPDAESLMRSRYSAFVTRKEGYLLASWHASTRPDRVEFESAMKWLGLEVRDRRSVDEAHAQVEFVARYRIAGKGGRMHERSRFVRESGRWYYVDAVS